MHTTIRALAGLAGVSGLLAGITLAAGQRSAAADRPQTIVAIERAVTDRVVDIGPKGDSPGDQLAFANPLFDAADARRIGHDQGDCVRTAAGATWECYWTAFLPGGQVTVEGPFLDAGDSTLAVTGGTGRYSGVRGELRLHARDARGSAYTFTYALLRAAGSR